MRAAVQGDYGSPVALFLDEDDPPPVGETDVLIAVRAAGVDAGVWHTTAGKPYMLRLFLGLRAPKQRIPGRDVAGQVAQVGAGVKQFAVGDEVFGTTLEGSFAEFTRTSEDRLAHKPANISFEQAAVVPVSGCAALHGLRDVGGLRAGERVLVLGAGGGVGSFAVQIAVALGATVTGVCSASKVDYVRSLGASRVIDYMREDFVDGTDAYDVILDTAGHNSLSRLRRVLTRGGTLVIVGGEGGGVLLGGFGRALRAPIVSMFSSQKLKGLISEEDQPALETLRDMLADRSITPVVDRAFRLEDAGAAISYVHAGRARGKVVVTV